MMGADVIRKQRNYYIVLVNDDRDILLLPTGQPIILDSLPKAKDLACENVRALGRVERISQAERKLK